MVAQKSVSLRSLLQDDPLKVDFGKLSSYIAPTCGVLLAAGTTYLFYKACQNYWRRRRLFGLIAIKRQQRDRQITELSQRLHTEDKSVDRHRQRIVSLGFDDLRAQLQSGQLTAVGALEAYQWRALEAHEQTNCVCEFLSEASVWAKKLDDQYRNGQKPPLFGIPVSVKESNQLTGHDNTMGFAQYIGQPASDDATLVTVLKELGAVPFVTTNIPQSMLSIGSSNPVYGVTTNPYDAERSSGGSSSGEGALIALRGSPLGVGTDIGGSVRVPAHWCGICSLKPSVARLAQGGRQGATPGTTGVKGTAGPMGSDVDSLVWFMRSVCKSPMYNLDPCVVPLPFDESLFAGDGHSLTIGYYDYDGWLEASPACRRAVDVARRLLEAKGHKLIRVVLPFDSKGIRRVFSAYTSALIPDGGEYLAAIFASDIVDPFHSYFWNFLGQPNWYRRLRSRFSKSNRSAATLGAFASNTAELRVIHCDIDGYRKKFLNFWHLHKLDAMLCPASASVALPYELPPKLFVILWAYTALYNLFDFSAGVVPCTYVTVADEEETVKEGKSKSGDEVDWVSRLIRKHSRGTVGLPVGVQCVALPYREEVCLRVMKEIEAAVNAKEEQKAHDF